MFLSLIQRYNIFFNPPNFSPTFLQNNNYFLEKKMDSKRNVAIHPTKQVISYERYRKGHTLVLSS
jgi:hypothetical protein